MDKAAGLQARLPYFVLARAALKSNRHLRKGADLYTALVHKPGFNPL